MERRTLAELLRGRRLVMKATVREMADRLGTSPMYVSYLERGEQVPMQPTRLQALANAYGLPISDVLDAATTSRAAKGSVELPTRESSPELTDAAVVLARTWLNLTADQINEIRRIAEEGGSDGAD